MTDAEQTAAFMASLQACVDYARSEYELKTATAIGCLEMLKLALFKEAMEDTDE